MMKTIVFFLSLIIISSACSKQIKPEHITCKENSDCVLIGTGSCCGRDTAINKSFANDFKKPPREMCKSVSMLCTKRSAVCDENKCKAVKD